MSREDFLAKASSEIEDIQHSLHAEATQRRDAQIVRGIDTLDGLKAYFAGDEDKPGQKYPGWVEMGWSRPTGAALDAVVEVLKGLKLNIRNTPLGAGKPEGVCPFTGAPAVETIYVARSY